MESVVKFPKGTTREEVVNFYVDRWSKWPLERIHAKAEQFNVEFGPETPRDEVIRAAAEAKARGVHGYERGTSNGSGSDADNQTQAHRSLSTEQQEKVSRMASDGGELGRLLGECTSQAPLRPYPDRRDSVEIQHRRRGAAAAPSLSWTERQTEEALGEFEYDEYLGLRFYHRNPAHAIHAACRVAAGRGKECLFIDHEFPTHESAYVVVEGKRIRPGIITASNAQDLQSPNLSDAKRSKRVVQYVKRAESDWCWVRGSSMSGRAVFSSKSSINPRNVRQGKVGNCGFCSGFASIAAQFPSVIARAFGDDAKTSRIMLSQSGVVAFRVYPRGQERYLLMDDYVLCQSCSDASPALHSALESDLWIRLIEKAFVKIQSSYASLDGFYKYNSLYRHPARALQLVTGAPLAVEMSYGKDAKRFNEVYEALVASQDVCARVSHCRRAVHGLYTGHGYSLLWVGEVSKNVRLVCCRNPWGCGSYTGKFGYGKKAWADVPALVSTELLKLPYFVSCPGTGRVRWRGEECLLTARSNTDHGRFPEDDDGIFLMEFEAYVEYFPITTLVGPLNEQSRPLSDFLLDAPDCIFHVGAENVKHVPQMLAAATAL